VCMCVCGFLCVCVCVCVCVCLRTCKSAWLLHVILISVFTLTCITIHLSVFSHTVLWESCKLSRVVRSLLISPLLILGLCVCVIKLILVCVCVCVCVQTRPVEAGYGEGHSCGLPPKRDGLLQQADTDSHTDPAERRYTYRY